MLQPSIGSLSPVFVIRGASALDAVSREARRSLVMLARICCLGAWLLRSARVHRMPAKLFFAGHLAGFAAPCSLLLPACLLLAAYWPAEAQAVSFGGTIGSGFNGPNAVALDTWGNLYIVDGSDPTELNQRITKIPPGGPQATLFDLVGNDFGTIAVDSSGRIYSGQVQLTAGGQIVLNCAPTVPAVACPWAGGTLAPLGIDPSSNLYFAFSGGSYLSTSFAQNGPSYILKVPPNDRTCASSCSVLEKGVTFPLQNLGAVDASGNIYLLTPNNIVKITTGGSKTNIPAAGFNSPYDPYSMAVDGAGNIYLTDDSKNRLAKITPAGVKSTVSTMGPLDAPEGVAVDSSGNIYVCDSSNNRVLVIRPGVSTGALNFESVPVGSTSAPQTINATFWSEGTLGPSSIQVLTQGSPNLDFKASGSCLSLGSFNYGTTCDFSITFAPTAPGLRSGAVSMQDASGNPLGVAYFYGVGVGPEIACDSPQTPSQATQVGGSLMVTPESVAVDGAGDVFITNFGQNEVVRVAANDLSCSTASDCTVTSFQAKFPAANPFGIALDGAGNVYTTVAGDVIQIARGGTQSFIEGNPSAGIGAPFGLIVDGAGDLFISGEVNVASNTYQVFEVSAGGVLSTLGGPLTQAQFMAVDAAGNVFASQSTLGLVTKIAPSGAETPVASGLSEPAGVAIDASGNLYVAETGIGEVAKITPAGVVTPVVTGLTVPRGIALDAHGNLYVACPTINQVLKFNRTAAPSLNFASTPVGATSSDSPQTVTVGNIGNAELTFPIPSTGRNPSISTNFMLNSSGSSDCSLVTPGSPEAGGLAAGADCLLPISFTPTTAGALTGALTLLDNNLNALAPGSATQSIMLSGTATGSTATALPAFTPIAGIYNSPQTVAIADVTTGAAIYYTVDGSTPTPSSTKYKTALTVSQTTTIKAIATSAGYSNSAVATATYTINLAAAAAPTFKPAAATYGEAQSVTIGSSTPNATIYYTTNGTTPTAGSTRYTVPVPVTASGTTIKAIAVATGYANSAPNSATYTLVGSPQVLAGLATGIATPAAKLNATVNGFGVAAQVWFLWGTSATALGSATAKAALPASTAAQAVNASVTGLKSKTTYY
ncbi:MAG: chitobiase/beta-hexosaminidase C-terminal domain-containing protein, partial [Terracidiphilus sp.]